MSEHPSARIWKPMRLIRVVESYDTSTGTTKVITDATVGYLKTMGNRQGPHVLAAEWVGTNLAHWFGLTVPDFAILRLPPEASFELRRGARVEAGPAFVSRHMNGRTWGGSGSFLLARRERKEFPKVPKSSHFFRLLRLCVSAISWMRHSPNEPKPNHHGNVEKPRFWFANEAARDRKEGFFAPTKPSVGGARLE